MRFRSRQRIGCRQILCNLAATLFVASAAIADPVATPRNVIVVILDDVGIDELSVYGGAPLAATCGTSCSCTSGTTCTNCDCTNLGSCVNTKCDVTGEDCSSDEDCHFEFPDTPFIDELARSKGVVFTNAYADPYCSSTRATMMTGRYGFRTGVGFAGLGIGPREFTIPKALVKWKDDNPESPDYSTAAIGKWHLSTPKQCNLCGTTDVVGFDYFAGSNDFLTYCGQSKLVLSNRNPQDPCPPTTIRQAYSTTDNVTDAINWICQNNPCGDGYCNASTEDAASCDVDCAQSPPMCGDNVCTNGESECTCRYAAGTDCCPAHCGEQGQPACPSGCQPATTTCTNPRSDNWFIWLAFNAAHDKITIPCWGETGCSEGCDPLDSTRKSYHAALEIVDCELGRLWDFLVQEQLDDDTTIVILGDNGSHDGVSRWPATRAKGSVYEGGVRVPLIVAGPDVEDTDPQTIRTSDVLINTPDIFATALELMGVNVPEVAEGVTLDSISFLPAILHEENSNGFDGDRDFVYVEVFKNTCDGSWHRAIRDDQYKLKQTCPDRCPADCEPNCPPGCSAEEKKHHRCFDTQSCTEEWYLTSDIRECCNRVGDATIKSAISTLRNKLPDDILCRADDACQGCCDLTECCHTPPCGGLPQCQCGPLSCGVTTNHECCPALTESELDQINVTWTGPGGTPQPGEDYSVYTTFENNTCLPHVVLKTTSVGGDAVQRYRVGRVDGQNSPLPLGAITTDWSLPPGSEPSDIRLVLGDSASSSQKLSSVDTADIHRESGSFWSGTLLDLSGSLVKRAEVSPSIDLDGDPNAGGRIAGEVVGTVKDIKAHAIGEEATTGGTLAVGGLASGGKLSFYSHPLSSELISTGAASTDASVAVLDDVGFSGLVEITDEFNGTLCGTGLSLSSFDSGCFYVNFGPNAQICNNPPICSGEDFCDPLSADPCTTTHALPALVAAEATLKNRYISFKIPSNPSTDPFAIRVRLDSLHHPTGPPNAPSFPAFEAKYRYVNAIEDGQGNPVYDCPDSAVLGSTFKCAVLGCAPQYRLWDDVSRFGDDDIHVTGDTVIPSSSYTVHLEYQDVDAACISCGFVVETARWGNVDGIPDDEATPNAIDISKVVDKVKDLATAGIEARFQLQIAVPNPYGSAVNAQDIGRVVDAVKGQPYPFTDVVVCPGED